MTEPPALHVTDGDSAARALVEAGVAPATAVLPWRDVLHEGPVPPALDHAALRRVRATFLATHVGVPADVLEADLAARDRTLARVAAGGRVVLWFESDLYDQLQLLQVLDRLHDRPVAVEVVPAPTRWDGGFVGLAEVGPTALATLHARREPAGPATRAAARHAWSAFRAGDVSRLAALADAPPPPLLPWLPAALRRLLEELPDAVDGLSRTERALLGALCDGPATAVEAFLAAGAQEERPFLGDATAFAILRRLGEGDVALVRVAEESPSPGVGPHARLALTAAGRRVLEGRADLLALGAGERRLGGLRLCGADAPRWDRRRGAPA